MRQYNGLKIPIYLCLLLILAIPLIVTNDLALIFITGKNFTFRIVVEVLFALYILLMLYDSRYQPKYSWILVSFSLLLFFSTISALLGVNPRFSLLGSYERMDGIVTLAHLFMYFLVLSHVIKTKEAWSNLFYVSVIVALIVVLRGIVESNPYSTLGNLQYYAVYLFFNVFFIAWLITQTSQAFRKFLLGCIGLILILAIIFAGERGVLFTTVCAGIILVSHLARERKLSSQNYLVIGSSVCLILLVLYLVAYFTDTLSTQPGLMRYLSMEQYKQGAGLRGHLWMMALQGFKDYPLLGWGPNNFSYVFNKYYNSFYCGHNMWYDKVHNNYLESLVTGGLIGFGAFLNFIFAPIIYLYTQGKKKFTVAERAILLSMMFGYLILNVFYFDSITSSICFVTVLAFIHGQVSKPILKWMIPKHYIPTLAMPTLFITTLSLIYYLTIPSLLAAHEAMAATHLLDLREQYQLMHHAWARYGIGNQELLDKLHPIVQNILISNAFSAEEKHSITRQTELELKAHIANNPLEPRTYYVLAMLAMATRDVEKTKKVIEDVWAITPNKEYTRMLQGTVEFEMGQIDKARESFQKTLCVRESQELYELVLKAQQQRT